MATSFEDVRLVGPPNADGEYVALGDSEIVHLHDYTRIYAVPGLYEHVVQEQLQCCSPQVAAQGFHRAAARAGLQASSITVLDVGAGTGLVGELLARGGVARIVGVDALTAARAACMRDRQGVYTDYLVGDLASPDSELSAALRKHRLGGLVSAGAFGGTHAPPLFVQSRETYCLAAAARAAVAFLSSSSPLKWRVMTSYIEFLIEAGTA